MSLVVNKKGRMEMRLRLVPAAIGLITLAVLVSACGGGDSKTAAVTPDSTFTIQAKNVKFLPDKLTVQAGSVIELKLENLDATEHDLQVEGLDADIMSGGSMKAEHGGGHGGKQMVAVHTMANEMGSIVFRANKKGTYNFYCTITGHKEAGMVGTLTVE